jgi:hypothetical protein
MDWSKVGDNPSDRELALIEAIREVAEQLAKIKEELSHIVSQKIR